VPFPDLIEIKVADFPRVERLEDIPALYDGHKATPDTVARLRADAERLGEARVFWTADLRRIQLGPMGAARFRELVGTDPEHDDLERVNCTEAGTTGHRMCGWCPEHAGPRFRCGCLAGEDDARRFASAAQAADERRPRRPTARHARQLWFYGGPDNDACTRHRLYKDDGTETFVFNGDFEFVDDGT
jgi:hypothetical protein